MYLLIFSFQLYLFILFIFYEVIVNFGLMFQVCKNWRMTLYHPSFWKQIVFDFKDKSRISWYR